MTWVSLVQTFSAVQAVPKLNRICDLDRYSFDPALSDGSPGDLAAR